jgi:hypothetical protein
MSGGNGPDQVGDWDPLFGRYAWWGDLNLYSGISEKSVGYMTNLKMFQADLGFSPAKKLAWRFTWEHMGAFHPSVVNPRIFGGGLLRGENLQTRLDFTVNASVRGHVDFETMLPGSFYVGDGRAYFARFEMIYTFRGSLPGPFMRAGAGRGTRADALPTGTVAARTP